SCHYFVTYLADQIALFFRKHTQLMVGKSSSFFKVTKGMNDLFGHACLRPYPEIVAASFCLGSPVLVGGYLYLAHGVCFYPEFHAENLELQKYSFVTFKCCY